MTTMEMLKAAFREFFVVDNHQLLLRFVAISIVFSVVIILLNP